MPARNASFLRPSTRALLACHHSLNRPASAKGAPTLTEFKGEIFAWILSACAPRYESAALWALFDDRAGTCEEWRSPLGLQLGCRVGTFRQASVANRTICGRARRWATSDTNRRRKISIDDPEYRSTTRNKDYRAIYRWMARNKHR